MRKIVLMLCVAVGGCNVMGSTTIERPRTEGAVASNRVSVPNVRCEEQLGLEPGTLTSEASSVTSTVTSPAST